MHAQYDVPSLSLMMKNENVKCVSTAKHGPDMRKDTTIFVPINYIQIM